MAERLVDAQAPGLARLVRDLGGLPHRTSEWPERMLIDLGRLALLLDAARRMERCLQTFLDYARPPKPERRPADLAAIVLRTFALILPPSGPGVVAILIRRPLSSSARIFNEALDPLHRIRRASDLRARGVSNARIFTYLLDQR